MTWICWLVACLTPSPPPAAGCGDCHGSDPSGAPPEGLGGVVDPAARGVGAHSTHLAGTERALAVACVECHAVPATTDAQGHVDSDVPAEVGWENGTSAKVGAQAYDDVAGTCTVYCHGSDVVEWTAIGTVTCGASCHGNPPPTLSHVGVTGDCVDCHTDGGATNPEHHVDGVLQLFGSTTGDGHTGLPVVTHTGTAGTVACGPPCHGTTDSPAPPPDTEGNTDSSFVGVGAHEHHLAGGPGFPPVGCGTCHTVPATADDPGHQVDDPGDDAFSGIATRGGRNPTWVSGTCSDTYCHAQAGAALPTPTWTGGPVGCGDCHATPPPPPHPSSAACAGCHGHSGDDPTLHLNGVLDR